MKIKTITMMIAALVCALFACKAQADGFKSVGVDEFEALIADTAVVRLDVRTAEEYAEGHIAGAVNIDVKNAGFDSQVLSVLAKDKTVAVYCRSGRRSKAAARKLVEMGYRVVELDNGFSGWKDAGKALEK